MTGEEAKKEAGKPNLKDRVLKWGAVPAAAVALGAAAYTPAASAERALRGTKATLFTEYGGSKPAEAESKLKDISELPGFGMEVTPYQRVLLKNSTLKITQPKSFEWQNGEGCSAIKVKTGGQEPLVSDGHCWEPAEADQSKYWVIDPLASPDARIAKDGSIYTVRDRNPMAVVEDISILKNPDIALLKVKPLGLKKEIQAMPGFKSRTFNEVAAVPGNLAIDEPLVGQEAVLSGVPSVNGNRLVTAKGIYIGRYEYNDGSSTQLVDVIAINAKQPSNNPCGRGGSGGAALLADNHILVSLIGSVNIGYGPGHRVYDYESDLTPEEANRVWEITENALEVKLSKSDFNTLCFLSVVDNDILTSLV